MIQIGAYIGIAILLGYFFGWLITRMHLKKACREMEKRYEMEIEAFISERVEITEKYKKLLAQKNHLKY